MSMNIDTPADFQRALDLFCPYTKVFICYDGGALCEPCARKESDLIKTAIEQEDTATGWWMVVALDTAENCECERCDHCNEKL